MCGLFSADLPCLAADNLEHSLATDDVLVHFFNDFLSLPSFPVTLLYNQEMGLFERVSGAAEFVSERVRSIIQFSKSQPQTAEPSVRTKTPPVDDHHTVCCLDREEGIQWIVQERLALFLKSDCYIEYRMTKLLCQSDPNIRIQRKKGCSGQRTRSAPVLCCSSQPDKKNDALNSSWSLKKTPSKCESMSRYNLTDLPPDQTERINLKPSTGFSHCSEPENPHISCSSSFDLRYDQTQELQGPRTDLCSEMQYLNDSQGQSFESTETQLKNMAARVVKQVLNNVLDIMNDQSQGNASNSFNESGELTKYTSEEGKSSETNVCQDSSHGGREQLEEGREKVQENKRGSAMERKNNWEVGSWDTVQENDGDIGCHGTRRQDNRLGLDEFWEFLRGTSGEKLMNLWMDIERLKCVQPAERKSRHLALMRSRYLLSSSQSSLNTELLSTLGLTTSPCWTEGKLCSVQPHLTDTLLCYWAPRFWTSPLAQDSDHDDNSNTQLWSERWSSPLSLTSPLLLPDTCMSQTPMSVHSQLYSSRSPSRGNKRMEGVIQALCVDSRAGFVLTHFCCQSGNQLWENAVYLWTDLQHYHELFYQDGLDAYRVQREAQLLYSTYLCTAARRSIGVDEEIRREVYNRLMPAFEELFDHVEEYALCILLQPWTLLLCRDVESLQKVLVLEEVRRVAVKENSEEHRGAQQRLKEVQHSGSTLSLPHSVSSIPFSKDHRTSNSWSSVSQDYKGYRLGSVLRHRQEIKLFMSFLQKEEASIHLTCWLDLEKYRRTSHKDEAVKQDRSSNVVNKYLNRKYFFGPDSPASTEQQNDILHLAGGMERLKLGCLSNLVVAEIQDIIRNHIEQTWLPQFLSTSEFTERRKHDTQLQAAGRLSQGVRQPRRSRRTVWKTSSLWMSSSKDILLFRQILLNPVSCLQFQHFVAVKGDFLENDVLFWLEVQRYKELCHSHSDETTIRRKISTIICCYIKSSVPPAVQIDIPPEQSQRILEKRHELGPYIFREAQLSVFNVLLKVWPEYEELCSSIQGEQLLPLLQEERVKHRARVRRQRRKEEEEEERRRTQEMLEARESTLREAEDVGSGSDDASRRERGSGRSSWRTQSRTPAPQSLSWTYSKYMEALKREELLMRRKSQLEASYSTTSDTLSSCSSSRTVDSPLSLRRSQRSSRADITQCHGCNRRVSSCNIK